MDLVLLGTLALLLGILFAIVVVRATAGVVWRRLKVVARWSPGP
jgi:hypothetical protein